MFTNRYAHLGPVLLRLMLAAVFILHGLPKLTTHGVYAGMFAKVGVPMPGVMAAVIGIVETGSGLLLLSGYATRVAAALLAATMAGAIFLVKLQKGFVNGYEFELLLLVTAVSLWLTGPGSLRTRADSQKNIAG